MSNDTGARAPGGAAEAADTLSRPVPGHPSGGARAAPDASARPRRA